VSFYKIARVVVKGLFHIAFRIKAEGRENIPKDENFVVCANHKSVLDPILLGIMLPFDFRFMAKEELFKNKLIGGILSAVGAFPVKRNTGDIGALKISIKTLEEGKSLAVFPEGTRSPEDYMNKGKAGAALIATKAKVNILPVGIEGKYKAFGKLTVKIGTPIQLSEYFGQKNSSEVLQDITDNRLMVAISELSGVPTYESRDSK